jgi:hypothetical protein
LIFGVRGGNLAATGKEKELSRQEGFQAVNLAEATWVKNLGHLSLLKDWFFIFDSGRENGDDDNVMGHRLPEYWRRWPTRYPKHGRLKGEGPYSQDQWDGTEEGSAANHDRAELR